MTKERRSNGVSIMVKITPRFSLPGEMILGIVALAWGIGGVGGNGRMHQILDANGDLWIWAATLIMVGGAMFGASTWEFLHGRSWTKQQLLMSASIRSTALFFSAFVWIYVLKLVVEIGATMSVLTLALSAPAFACMSVWFFYETMRVKYALDERYSTPGLVVRL
jgi:hypothetical protein